MGLISIDRPVGVGPPPSGVFEDESVAVGATGNVGVSSNLAVEDVSVSVSATGNVGVADTLNGGTITTLATINWTNGTGTSEFAWTDGVPARNAICDPSTINPTVRAAADEGWTGPGNVFRAQNTTAGCGGLLLQDLMPVPTNGDVWVLRWSFKQNEEQIREHLHTIVGFSPNNADSKVVLNRTGGLGASGGSFNHTVNLDPADFGWNARNAGNTGYLQCAANTWYRFEVAFEWSTQDSSFIYYRAYLRMYDSAGNLLADESNYRAEFINGDFVNQFLDDYYAGGGFLQYPVSGLTDTTVGVNVRDFWVGISRSYANDQGLHYWAGVNVGTADSVTFYGAY